MNGLIVTLALTAALGDWRFQKELNPMTDRAEATLMRANVGATGMYGAHVLAFRCNPDNFDIIVSVPLGEMLEDTDRTRIRFDQDAPRTVRVVGSTDRRGLFILEPKKLLGEFRSKNRFVVELTPYNARPRSVVFDLSGSFDQLKRLDQVCGE